MHSILNLAALVAFFATGVFADDTPMSLCTADNCETCPNSVTTTGTGYPSCVIYDTEQVLGSTESQYPDRSNNKRSIWFDVAKQGTGCKAIIRTPASVDDVNCGVPIYGGAGGVCVEIETSPTFMVQFCCGDGDCSAAGLKRSGAMSSTVLKDADGNLIIPHSVGDVWNGDMLDVFLHDHGLNTSSAIRGHSASGIPIFKIGHDNAMEKRDCDKFTTTKQEYTKSGSQSYKVSQDICDGNEYEVSNDQTIEHTTTFSSSVSDPFGIVSASVGFETTESATQSYKYNFKAPEGQCGHVSWTPTYTCIGGTITGCEGGDQNGEVCTAKYISGNADSPGQLDGTYRFVQDGS